MVTLKLKLSLMIILSMIISEIISMSADLNKLELGALVNIIYPIISGLITLAFFLAGCLITKIDKYRIILALILVITNLSIGMYIRYVDV